MKALLIGGTGYLGRSLCATLARNGFDLVVGQYKQTASAPLNLKAKVAPVRLTDKEATDQLLDSVQPDVVIHLASSLIPASNLAEYLQERRDLLDPTVQFLFCLAERRIPIVFFSSGGAVYGPTDESKLIEDSRCRPISFYGQAKLELEELIRFVGRTAHLSYLILRPSNPFGGSQSLSGRQGLVAAVLGCVRDKRPLRIWGDGQVVRDYIYVDDLCAATAHLISARAAGVINIGSGIGYSALEVVRTVEQVVDRSVDVEFSPGRPVDVPRIVLDVSRATSLGVPPIRSFSDGVRVFATDIGLLGG